MWGGNSATSQAFDVSGLRIWVHSRVHGDGDRGGDVYFVSSCASGQITRLLVADVSGHGPAVSHTADRLRASMSANVNRINQEHIVRSVNEEFAERNETSGFATAVVSTYFAPTKKLTLSNAGHPPPLLYRAADREWSVYEPKDVGGPLAKNLPLGIVPETRFDQSDVRLADGDMVLLYTDAFYEARDVDGQILSADGLLRLIQSLDPHEPDRLVARLIESIANLRPGNLDGDDATVILIWANGSQTPLWNSLTAPFRYLGSLVGWRSVQHVDPSQEIKP